MTVIFSPFFQRFKRLTIARPRLSAHLLERIDLEPIELAAIGEAEQIGVRRGDEEVLDRASSSALAPGAPLPPRCWVR